MVSKNGHATKEDLLASGQAPEDGGFPLLPPSQGDARVFLEPATDVYEAFLKARLSYRELRLAARVFFRAIRIRDYRRAQDVLVALHSSAAGDGGARTETLRAMQPNAQAVAGNFARAMLSRLLGGRGQQGNQQTKGMK